MLNDAGVRSFVSGAPFLGVSRALRQQPCCVRKDWGSISRLAAGPWLASTPRAPTVRWGAHWRLSPNQLDVLWGYPLYLPVRHSCELTSRQSRATEWLSGEGTARQVRGVCGPAVCSLGVGGQSGLPQGWEAKPV